MMYSGKTLFTGLGLNYVLCDNYLRLLPYKLLICRNYISCSWTFFDTEISRPKQDFTANGYSVHFFE